MALIKNTHELFTHLMWIAIGWVREKREWRSEKMLIYAIPWMRLCAALLLNSRVKWRMKEHMSIYIAVLRWERKNSRELLLLLLLFTATFPCTRDPIFHSPKKTHRKTNVVSSKFFLFTLPSFVIKQIFFLFVIISHARHYAFSLILALFSCYARLNKHFK